MSDSTEDDEDGDECDATPSLSISLSLSTYEDNASNTSSVGAVVSEVTKRMEALPAYPFPADYSIEYCGTSVGVIQHCCRRHPTGTQAVAIFFPGVHGGVGPCRLPGSNFDNEALFPTVCQRLTARSNLNIDCYRVSWPNMQPPLATAVAGGIRVLNHALMQAMRQPGEVPAGGATADNACSPGGQELPKTRRHRRRKELRTLKVIFVGHSLGGAVAYETASVVARHFGPNFTASKKRPAVMHVAGLCTLNAAMMSNSAPELIAQLSSLSNVPSLMISGEQDKVVNPCATSTLFEAMPGSEKRLLSLSGGTHDLYTHKEQLIEELSQFISIQCAGAAQ